MNDFLTSIRLGIGVLGLTLLAAMPSQIEAGHVHFSTTTPGTLNSNASVTFAVNSTGQVVGWYVSGPHRAFLYDNEMMTDLGTLNHAGGPGQAFKNSSVRVGISAISSSAASVAHAFVRENDVMTGLGTLSDVDEATNSGIGSYHSGHLVGTSKGGIGGKPSFLFDTMTGPGMISGHQGTPIALKNSNGQPGGHANFNNPIDASDVARGLLHNAGPTTGFGTIDGRGSSATAIADNGALMGDSATAHGLRHAFTNRNGQELDLSILPIGKNGAWGIDNVEQIVGSVNPQADEVLPFENGSISNVNELTNPSLSRQPFEAWSMNDAEQTSGNDESNSERPGLILTSAPVPPGAVLFGLGFLTLSAVAALKRRRHFCGS